MKMREKGAQVLRGFCMGCADIIPGVSGGTIALVLGIYERLILSISLIDVKLIKIIFTKELWTKFFSGLVRDEQPTDDDISKRVQGLHFISFLVFGILLAVVVMSGLIKYARAEHPTVTRAFFFGLVLVSIYVPLRRVRKFRPLQAFTLVAFSVLTYVVLGLGAVPHEPQLWYVFICGAIAISAMILPGLSGAFLLLMLGLYDYILNAVHNLKQLDTSGLIPILVLIAGILVGIIVFSRFLNYLLAKHHDTTMASLVGLMLGSLRVLWPFKEQSLDAVRDEFMANRLPMVASEVDPNLLPSIIAFVVATGIVIVFIRIGEKMQTSDKG
jgi:putative membrane protein